MGLLEELKHGRFMLIQHPGCGTAWLHEQVRAVSPGPVAFETRVLEPNERACVFLIQPRSFSIESLDHSSIYGLHSMLYLERELEYENVFFVMRNPLSAIASFAAFMATLGEFRSRAVPLACMSLVTLWASVSVMKTPVRRYRIEDINGVTFAHANSHGGAELTLADLPAWSIPAVRRIADEFDYEVK